MTLLLSGCACIPGSKMPANTDRYFLYAANDRVYCLDSKTGKTDEIRTAVPVSGINNALIADSGKKMAFEATIKDSEDYALFYWDGKSDSANLVDKNADMARINKKMDFLIYMKAHDGHYDLYQHDLKKHSVQRIAENVNKVSMTEDGKSILYLQAIPEEEQFVLFQKKRNSNPKRISEVSLQREVSATPDHKVVCYTKGESENVLGGLCSAYMWTPTGGEKQLPFKATDIKVFDKDEIYYIASGSGFSCYYYNGKTSKLLSEAASGHGHKLSDEIYSYRGIDENSEKYTVQYAVHKGKQTDLGGYVCSNSTKLGGLSSDGKTVYSWYTKGRMYRTTLGVTGNLSTEQYLNTGNNYTPRGMQFYGDHLAYADEGRLYLDGQMIASEYEDFELSVDGKTLVYTSNGCVYRYSDGKSTFLCRTVDTHLPTASKNVVLVDGGVLYLGDGNKTEQIAADCQDIAPARPWSVKSEGNIIIDGWTTGMWYTMMGTDLIVY